MQSHSSPSMLIKLEESPPQNDLLVSCDLIVFSRALSRVVHGYDAEAEMVEEMAALGADALSSYPAVAINRARSQTLEAQN